MTDTNKTPTLEKFSVKGLDLSGITDADLQSSFASYIRTPGTYDLRINDVVLRAPAEKRDGAGKQWGSLQLNASDVASGDKITSFVDVPLESLLYTSKEGKQSKVKTQIFVNLLAAATGTRPTTDELPSAITKLPSLLTGATIRAKIDQRKDHVAYLGKTADGAVSYGIMVRGGAKESFVRMVNADNEPMSFDSYKGAAEYYQSMTNRKPGGLEITSFYAKKGDANGSEL